jgi:hypothetical protein
VKRELGLWMGEENGAEPRLSPEGLDEIWAEQLRESPPPKPQFGLRQCKTGFRRGFSQLTICREGGKYKPSGFPTQAQLIFPQCALGTKETCEEKL